MICLLILDACHKNNNTTTTGGGGNTINSSITPSNATSYNAILSISSIQTLYGNNLLPSNNYCKAYFSNSTTSNYNTTTFVKVNNVNLNGTVFKFLSYDYEDTTHNITYPSGIWNVNGLGNIPSFTFTVNNPIPSYIGYTSLPDTVHINQSITLPITGITGSDQTTITITDGSNANGHIVSQALLNSANSVTFSAYSLSNMSITSNAFINVHCIKNNVQNVYGIPMNFTTEYQLDKIISIK